MYLHIYLRYRLSAISTMLKFIQTSANTMCHAVSFAVSLQSEVRVVQPTSHELFQTSLRLLHVSPDVLALQAVCIDLHDVD